MTHETEGFCRQLEQIDQSLLAEVFAGAAALLLRRDDVIRHCALFQNIHRHVLSNNKHLRLCHSSLCVCVLLFFYYT